jgi:hypothetical protein
MILADDATPKPDGIFGKDTEGNQRYSWIKNNRSPLVSWTRPLTFRRNMVS